jgi:hypothetical protein
MVNYLFGDAFCFPLIMYSAMSNASSVYVFSRFAGCPTVDSGGESVKNNHVLPPYSNDIWQVRAISARKDCN